MAGKSKEQMIHEAAMQVMAEAGVKIVNEKAAEILKKNGIRMEGEVAYFTEEQVMEWVKKAPSDFTIYARNPKYNTYMGGRQVNPAPTYGCAFVDDWDGTRRTGTLEDSIKALKLVQAEDDVYTINGGIIVQPGDVPQENASIVMFYADLMTSDKAILLPTGYKDEMNVMMEACYEIFGGKEEFVSKPRMIALINTVSPLTLDERMLDCLMVLAEHGQPAILCPASMLAATSSWSMAGSLVSGTAEVLAGIVVAEMVNPGAPVVFGIQSTAADMRGGITFACAAPEGCLMQGFAPNMGAFYGVPSRGGGCQTDAPVINCQAGYESMLTYFSAYNSGINIVMEAGGTMDSVNSCAFEKMVIDFEIMRQVKFWHDSFVCDEETLNVEEIIEIGPGGTFVTAESTMDNYTELYNPHIGSRTAKANDPEYFHRSINKEMQKLFDRYNKTRPVMDDDMKAKVREILGKTGLEAKYFDKMEELAAREEVVPQI